LSYTGFTYREKPSERKIVKIEIANLTEKNLSGAPEWESYPFSCKYCIYWEHPELCVGPTAQAKEDALHRKTEWLRTASLSFGNCGKLVYVDGVAVGYAQYAPPGLFPQAKNYPAGPLDPMAVFIACLFIPRKEFRGLGLGSRLFESVLADLRQKGAKAVETVARKGGADNPSGPVEFYFNKGFKITREDVEFPLLHLDL
jgi:GNAT superfamily N-acetyltransferase